MSIYNDDSRGFTRHAATRLDCGPAGGMTGMTACGASLPVGVCEPPNMKPAKNVLHLPRITICGAAQLRDLNHADFTHVVSIWGAYAPRIVASRLDAMFPKSKIHVAFFDDVLEGTTESGAPSSEHVRDILSFGSSLTAKDSLLVQCLAGISRSSASAYSIACQLAGAGHEQEILERLVRKHPGIRPNPRIVRMADEILERNGVMLSALESHL